MFPMVANCNCLFFLLRLNCVGPFVTSGFIFHFFIFHMTKFLYHILYLTVSFVVVANFLLNRNVVSVNLSGPRKVLEEKMSLREIFKEPYRLKIGDSNGETEFYEICQLYQRFLLAIVAKLLITPFSYP